MVLIGHAQSCLAGLVGGFQTERGASGRSEISANWGSVLRDFLELSEL